MFQKKFYCSWNNIVRGPQDYVDALLLELFFNSVNLRDCQKWFVCNWRNCTVKTDSARKLGQSPMCHYPRSSAHWGYFRQSLTRLVQNLTLRNDCNLIPSAHGTQQLFSQCDHGTTRGFTSWNLPNQRPVAKTWSEDWQCSALSSGWFPHTGFEHSTFRSEGEHANLYTTNASSARNDINN